MCMVLVYDMAVHNMHSCFWASGAWRLEMDSLVSLEHHDGFARFKASRYWSDLYACDLDMHSKLGTSAISVQLMQIQTMPINIQPMIAGPYATNSTIPPASLIFLSASLLKNLARTTNGISGILPLPSTFE